MVNKSGCHPVIYMLVSRTYVPDTYLTRLQSAMSFSFGLRSDRINTSLTSVIAFIETTKMLRLILVLLLYAPGHMPMIVRGSIGDLRPTMLEASAYDQRFEHGGDDAGDELEHFLKSIEEDEAYLSTTNAYDEPLSCISHSTGVPYTVESRSLMQHIPKPHVNDQHSQETSYTQGDGPHEPHVTKDIVPTHDVQTGKFLKRKNIDLPYGSTFQTQERGILEERILLPTTTTTYQSLALPMEVVSGAFPDGKNPDYSTLGYENPLDMKECNAQDVEIPRVHSISSSLDTTPSNFFKIHSPNLVCAAASVIFTKELASEIMDSAETLMSWEDRVVVKKIWTTQTLLPFVYCLLLRNPWYGTWKRIITATSYIILHYHVYYLTSKDSIENDSVAIFLLWHMKMLHEMCDPAMFQIQTLETKNEMEKFSKRYKARDPHNWICDIFHVIHDQERFKLKFKKNHMRYRSKFVSGYVWNLQRSHIEQKNGLYQKDNQEISVFKNWMGNSYVIQEICSKVAIIDENYLINKTYQDESILHRWGFSSLEYGSNVTEKSFDDKWKVEFRSLNAFFQKNQPIPLYVENGIHGISLGLSYFIHKHHQTHNLELKPTFDPRIISRFYECLRSKDSAEAFWEELRAYTIKYEEDFFVKKESK